MIAVPMPAFAVAPSTAARTRRPIPSVISPGTDTITPFPLRTATGGRARTAEAHASPAPVEPRRALHVLPRLPPREHERSRLAAADVIRRSWARAGQAGRDVALVRVAVRVHDVLDRGHASGASYR